jgi:hypothetical protein
MVLADIDDFDGDLAFRTISGIPVRAAPCARQRRKG